ncbi:MAG: hypothetical protein AAF571_10345 [Verrucomicrobiota bacterium]
MRQPPKKKRSSTKEPRYYDSMKAAAAGMGIPVSLLRQAKNHGCAAFRGSRVYVKEFMEWKEDNPNAEELLTADKERLQEEKLRKEIQLLDIKIAAERGAYIERSQLEDEIPKHIGTMVKIARKFLPTTKYNAFCEQATRACKSLVGEDYAKSV